VSICAGDCNDDGAIGITELIAAVSEALGAAVSGDCASFDRDGSGAVTVDELIALVAAALDGCSL
jgi:Ca2+-binding EF-hand superfamily protein